MHKLYKLKNRIMAILMCILLLSNLGLSITLASSQSGATAAFITFHAIADELPTTSIKAQKMTAVYKTETVINSYGMLITPSETGIYTITLASGHGELRYSVGTAKSNGKDAIDTLRLAARYGNQKYTILTENVSSASTTIDVILEKGQTYIVIVDSFPDDEFITLSLQKRNIQKLAMAGTNISSDAVSLKKNSKKLQNYIDPDIKIVEFDDETIQKYINDGEKQEEEIESGSTFEGIITDLIIALGSVFITIVEWAVNSNVPLTIDNIIFNRFEQTVIDLTPLGGIQVGSSAPYTGKGIFNEPNVGEIIKILYDALKNLATIIYIIMLLYIGVKILLSVGGKEQSKYFKYLEYWLTGLILLVILPYFLPVIPVAANSIVGMMEEEAKSLNGDYSVEEVLEKLSGDASLLGEDAEVIELHKLIDEKITNLNAQINGTPGTREEAQAKIDANIQNALGKFHGNMSGLELNELKQKIEKVKDIIDLNYHNWTQINQDEYEKAIQEVKDYIFETVEVARVTDNIKRQLPAEVREDQAVVRSIEFIGNFVKNNASKWDSNPQYQTTYNNRLKSLKSMLANSGREDLYDICFEAIEKSKREFINYAKSPALAGLESLFEDYKDAVIQMEIKELEDLKNKINNDVMTTLKTEAQTQNRVVYAIAWAILLYQMIAILMMYYKRVFVTIVLIVFFPIVMAFYVIDKSGDGESQSLSNWLREFLAIILVQVLHAGVYVILINIGIDACNIDPKKNWFFLILTVCFLFPGERIVRSIVGLKSSTIDGLKNNISGTIMGMVAVRKLVTNGYRSVRNGAKTMKEGGYHKKLQEEFKKQEKAVEEKRKAQEEQAKKKKKAQKQREALRRERQDNIAKGAATTGEKIHEAASKVKDGVKNFAPVKLAAGAYNGTKNFFSKAKSSKFLRGVGKAYRVGKFTLKKGSKIAQKGFGMTMGALEGMENFSQGGALSGLHTARSVAHNLGGFKDKKPIPKEGKVDPQRFSTVYNNGKRVAGSGANAVRGSLSPNVSTRTSATVGAKAKVVRDKLNITTSVNGSPNSGSSGGGSTP